MPRTPNEWLEILSEQLDQQAAEVAHLRRYVNNDPPLPEMAPAARKAWIAFQKKARTNFGMAACQSHANRIRVRGIRVGADDKSEASQAARRIWRDNRMPIVINEAIWNMLVARTGYIVAGVDSEGQPLLTAELPENLYAEPDPVRSWRSQAAIKTWRDTINDTDWAILWTPGTKTTYNRPSTIDGTYQPANVPTPAIIAAGGGWQLVTSEQTTDKIPVWIFSRYTGQGLIEPHLDVLDRMNLDRLQRLTTSAIQIFKQRYLKKGKDSARFGKDFDGETYFQAAPGIIWDLPEGFEIAELSTADIQQMLQVEKHDIREFAAVTGTPISMLISDDINQSAAGARNTTAQQVDACNNDISSISISIASAMVTALNIAGIDLDGQTVEIDFLNPEHVTLAEQYDAASKAAAAGISLPTIQKTILGWSQDQIVEDENHRQQTIAFNELNNLSRESVQTTPPTEPGIDD